jgi:hypothetical protein
MHHLSRDELKMLMQRQTDSHVSLYMPTYQAGADVQQNVIRCKNLLREAEARLLATGLRTSEVHIWLEPIQQLVVDNAFWQQQSDGLALFCDAEIFRAYCLPLTFAELVVVAERFHLKPLLPLFTGDGRFYVLALSQNAVRLLQCTRYHTHAVALTNVPQSLADALRYDDPEKQLQFHTGAPPGGGGLRAAMYHGHGIGEDAKDNIRGYFRQIDQGVREVLREEQAPLVLAGVDYLLPLYHEVSGYPHLVESGITGNPEGIRDEDLHASAWPLLEPIFRQAQDEAQAHYARYMGTARASEDLTTIVPAAHDGRIDILFVADGTQQWGKFTPGTRDVQIHSKADAQDEDLLDFAAVHTFINGGTVYVMAPDAVPGGQHAAAVFRYAA